MSDFTFKKEIQAATQTPADRAKRRFSTFWPFVIVLMTLIFSTVRDGVTLYKRTLALRRESAQQEGALKKAGTQALLLDTLKGDLETLAISDPIAAKIDQDFFPPPAQPPSLPSFPPAPSKLTVTSSAPAPKPINLNVTPTPAPFGQKPSSQGGMGH